MDRLIDSGTIKEVRKILDAALGEAIVQEKKFNRLKRGHYVEALRGGGDSYIVVEHMQDICEERTFAIRQLVNLVSGLAKGSQDMVKAIQELLAERDAAQDAPQDTPQAEVVDPQATKKKPKDE